MAKNLRWITPVLVTIALSILSYLAVKADSSEKNAKAYAKELMDGHEEVQAELVSNIKDMNKTLGAIAGDMKVIKYRLRIREAENGD